VVRGTTGGAASFHLAYTILTARRRKTIPRKWDHPVQLQLRMPGTDSLLRPILAVN